MGLFGFGKKGKVIDLGKKFREQEEEKILNQTVVQPKILEIQNVQSPVSSEIPEPEDSESIEEKRKKLAKRLMDMATKIDELSNQIYLLQQRIEVLEKKTGSFQVS